MALRIEPQAEPIPGYRLLERLGAGGYGEVWKAEAPGGLLKAIKIVREEGRSGAETGGLAQQELKALKRVQSVRHPYLLSIDRYDVIDGNLLIVTELADCNLWDRWRVCRDAGLSGIPREELLRYLAEAAEVLDLMLTRHQLQHFDVKPQNLFLIHDHVKVADFGLVKELHAVQGAITGGVTPYYAAPETFDGKLSRHCDQYSLAIVYQELLTGERPFVGESIQHLIMQHLQAKPNLSPLPPGDRPAVERALAKSVDDRFDSCMEFVRALRGNIVETPPPAARESRPDDAQPINVRSERQGDGVLVPALIIGLGGVGGEVLQRLRGQLADLPHIRLLHIDTDASAAPGLADDERLLVPFAPASHYLQPAANGQRPVDGWLDSQILNRLARQAHTQGLRGLGRLAFVDHAAAVAQRLTFELNYLSEAETVAAGERATGMGLRSDRPRVTIVAGLGGGTGGGMIFDVAYLARHALVRCGWSAAEVAGWLLAPPVERGSPAEVRAAGNSCAALIELNHFSLPHTTWHPLGLGADGPPATRSAPFASVVVVPLRSPGDPEAADGIGLAVDGLTRELLTPLGRIGEARRAGTARSGAPSCRTFGAVRFVWPRHAIHERAARVAVAAIVRRWTLADAARLREPVQAWIAEQWAALSLGQEHLTSRFHEACTAALGQSPEDAFAACDEPPQAAAPDRLIRIEELAGRPADDTLPATPGRAGEALLAAAKELSREWTERIASLPPYLLDHPDFRLAGAETGIRVLGESAERMLGHFGPLSEEWLRRSVQARSRIDALMADGGSRNTDLHDALRLYPRWRFQGMLLGRVAAVFAAVSTHLADALADLSRLRERLDAALSELGDGSLPAIEAPADIDGYLLPDDCATIDDAAEHVAAKLNRDERRDLERRIYDAIRDDRSAATSAIRLAPVLIDIGREFLSPRLRDLEGAFDGHRGGTASALAAAWQAAEPALGIGAAEWTALLAPPGSAGEALAAIARQEFAASPEVVVGPPDSLAVIREAPALPLAILPHVGRDALEAFYLVSRADGVAPHARFDVAEWSVIDRA